MKNRILQFVLLTTFSCFGQNCVCTKSMFYDSNKTIPDSTFTFSNKKQIMLCGYKEKIKSETFFSEFIVQICGNESEIEFWNATQSCKITMQNDTLKITEIKNLPTGINRSYQDTEWRIDKIYFINEKLNHNFRINPNIRKYSEQEIKTTITEFKEANGKMDDYKIVIANRLFISILSGSRKAKECFNNFKRKFGPLDGAHAEEFSDLENMINEFEL
jgi:hypothetical protein